MDEAPTAERASRNAGSYGFTTRKSRKPKLLMARAAAPIFNGLRVDTSTMRTRSSCAAVAKAAYSKAPADSFLQESYSTPVKTVKGCHGPWWLAGQFVGNGPRRNSGAIESLGLYSPERGNTCWCAEWQFGVSLSFLSPLRVRKSPPLKS